MPKQLFNRLHFFDHLCIFFFYEVKLFLLPLFCIGFVSCCCLQEALGEKQSYGPRRVPQGQLLWGCCLQTTMCTCCQGPQAFHSQQLQFSVSGNWEVNQGFMISSHWICVSLLFSLVCMSTEKQLVWFSYYLILMLKSACISQRITGIQGQKNYTTDKEMHVFWGFKHSNNKTKWEKIIWNTVACHWPFQENKLIKIKLKVTGNSNLRPMLVWAIILQ